MMNIYRPDEYSFSTCISAWAKSGEKGSAQRAKDLLHRMEELGMEPNNIVLSSVIHALTKSRESGSAEKSCAVAGYDGRSRYRCLQQCATRSCKEWRGRRGRGFRGAPRTNGKDVCQRQYKDVPNGAELYVGHFRMLEKQKAGQGRGDIVSAGTI